MAATEQQLKDLTVELIPERDKNGLFCLMIRGVFDDPTSDKTFAKGLMICFNEGDLAILREGSVLDCKYKIEKGIMSRGFFLTKTGS